MSGVLVGDCRTLVAEMEPDSFDAIVTDPPYEIGFMGRKWDRAGVAFDAATWAACYRVLKPGGRLLAFGAPRTAHRIWCAIEDGGFQIEDTIMWVFGSGFPKHRSKLKPAYEPICVARKGGASPLNIDDCRIGLMTAVEVARSGRSTGTPLYEGGHQPVSWKEGREPTGRWPANVILDEVAGAVLDEMSGELTSNGGGGPRTIRNTESSNARRVAYSDYGQTESGIYGDSGGASRFFYVAKASRSERDAGLDDLTKRAGGSTAKGFTADVANGQDRNRPVANFHPTVKPVELMRCLVRLVTPAGGTVLDPFTGSGSTGVACIAEGRSFIGCELDAAHADIARARIAHAHGPLFADGAA